MIAEVEAGSPHYIEATCRHVRALLRLARGDAKGALADSERMLEYGRSVGDPQVLWPALAVHARMLASAGDLASAGVFDEAVRFRSPATWSRVGVADFAAAAAMLGRDPFAERSEEAFATPWIEAARAMCLGDFARAAAIYGGMGSRPDEADARLLAAKALVEAGRRAEADEQLRRVLAFYRDVGASAYLREGEALLAASA